VRINVLLVIGLLFVLIPPQSATQAEVNLVGSLIYPNASGAYWSEAGFNDYSNEYMAIWIDVTDANGWQSKGQRINAATGNLVGSVFYISDNPAAYGALGPEVVYNSVNHEWFVVYKAGVAEQNEDVYAQRYDSSGNPIGGHIGLVVRSGFQNDAHVAHDPTNNRYLVTFEEKVGDNKQVFCRLFDSTGSPISIEIQLSEVNDRTKWTPLVVYNPVYNEYMVIWEDMRHYPGTGQDNAYKDIYGQRVDVNGAKIGANIPIYSPPAPYVPNGQDNLGGFTCNTTDGKYAMGITKLTAANGYDTYGMVFDRFGNSDNGAFVVYAPTDPEQAGSGAVARYNPASNTYYITCRDSSSWIMGMEVSSAGLPIAPVEYLFTPGVGIREPSLTIRPSDGQFCSIMSLGNGAVAAQRFTTTPDVTPPGAVTNFIATAGASATNNLTWTNPSESDYSGAMIRYRTDGIYPVDVNDGQLAVDKAGVPNTNDSFAHTNLDHSLTYYYSVFAHDSKPNYATGVNAQAMPYSIGDFDLDRDVDLEDFGKFQACYSGEGVLYETDCGFADLSGDGDVDLSDFAIMQPCITGTNIPPGC